MYVNLFKNLDAEVMKSTRYIALVVLIGSLLMQAVFLIIGLWDMTVLWGNLLGASAALVNFFLMAVAVAGALSMSKEDAQKKVKASHGLRMVFLFVVCAIGAAAPCFNLIAVAVPLVMPSIGAKLHALFVKDDAPNPSAERSELDELSDEGEE